MKSIQEIASSNPNLTLKFYNDPGHGWLAVKRTWLTDLGIADQISSYSYQKGATVYLEEDDDASRFIVAVRGIGVVVSFKDKHHSKWSPIRSYDCYRKE